MRSCNPKDLIIVAILSAALFVFAHRQAWTDPYVVNDDVRQQIYWMQKWQDPSLFQSDPLSEYARMYVPWGVQGIYRLASPLWDPLTFSKVLPGLLFVFLAGCFFQIGGTIKDRQLAWITVGVFWLMPFFLDRLSGGLARSFGTPLLALFLLFWLTRRPMAMGITLLAQALLIPYIFLVSATAVLGAWAFGHARNSDLRPPFPSTPVHVSLILLSAGLVFWMGHAFNAGEFGPLVGRSEVVNHPEFGPSGRYFVEPFRYVIPELFVFPIGRIAPFQELGLVWGVVGCLLTVVLVLAGLRRLDRVVEKANITPFIHIGAAALFLFTMGHLFLMKMFVPSRYLEYPVHILYCLVMALGIRNLIQGLGGTIFTSRSLKKGGGLALLLSLVVVASGLRLDGTGLYDYSSYRPLYDALAGTPKSGLFAGHPVLMDNIPTFAGRRALVTFELSHPWSRGLWERLKPTTEALFEAYYAEDLSTVLAFCETYGVDYLIVDDRHFTPAFLAESPYFAPFDDHIRRMTRTRDTFCLLEDPLPGARVIDKHIRLIDIQECVDGPVTSTSRAKPHQTTP